MWRRVEIRNYRSIEHVQVDLAPFTIVVGPNGSGKSNFADAILFADEVCGYHEDAIRKRGGLERLKRRGATPSETISVDVTKAETVGFRADESYRHKLDLRVLSPSDWEFESEILEFVDAQGHRRRFVRHGEVIEAFENGSPRGEERHALPHVSLRMLMFQYDANSRALNWVQGGQTGPSPFLAKNDWGHRGKVKRFRFDPEAMRQPRPAGDATLSESGENIALAVKVLSSMDGVIDVMQRIVPGLTEISTEEAGGYVVLVFKQRQGSSGEAQLNATQLSDGALRALGIVVAVEQMRQDDLLIFEEPEASLHPGAANLLFDILKAASEKGAILVTTHSPDLLSAAGAEEILVCEYRDGATRIGPLSEGQHEVVREGLFSVAELMRAEPLRIEGSSPRTIDPATVHP